MKPTLLKIFGGFGTISGATYPLRALKIFLQNPELFKYIIVPIIVNIIIAIALYGSLLFLGFQFVDEIRIQFSLWLERLIANLPQWLEFLSYSVPILIFFLRLILIIILLIISGFLLTQFGVLLGAPWYGQLSERLEKFRTGRVEIIEINIFQDLGRAVLYELKKIVLIAVVGILLLLFSLFTGVGTLISTIGSLILTVTIVCLDFLDSTLERRRLKFRHKLKIVFKSLPASGSFGLVCLGLISIPLVNLVTIPLCVASGTLFVCDRILPRLSSSS